MKITPKYEKEVSSLRAVLLTTTRGKDMKVRSLSVVIINLLLVGLIVRIQ